MDCDMINSYIFLGEPMPRARVIDDSNWLQLPSLCRLPCWAKVAPEAQPCCRTLRGVRKEGFSGILTPPATPACTAGPSFTSGGTSAVGAGRFPLAGGDPTKLTRPSTSYFQYGWVSLGAAASLRTDRWGHTCCARALCCTLTAPSRSTHPHTTRRRALEWTSPTVG